MKLQNVNRFRLSMLSSFLLIGVVLLAACGPASSASTPTPTAAAVMDTQAPIDTTSAMTPTTADTMAATATTAATMSATDTPIGATPTAPATTSMTDTPSGPTPTGAAVTPMTTTTINVSAPNASLGAFLVDANNMTLYIFKNDTADTSTCTGGCASTWPLLVASNGTAPKAGSGVTGTLGVITRSDGIMQVTYNHQPLYYYKADTKAGDTNGQGVGTKWYVVAP